MTNSQKFATIVTMARKETRPKPDNTKVPYIEDFWGIAEDRKEYPRMQEDGIWDEIQALRDALENEGNVVGLARHEPPRDFEDIGALPRAWDPESETPARSSRLRGFLGAIIEGPGRDGKG